MFCLICIIRYIRLFSGWGKGIDIKYVDFATVSSEWQCAVFLRCENNLCCSFVFVGQIFLGQCSLDLFPLIRVLLVQFDISQMDYFCRRLDVFWMVFSRTRLFKMTTSHSLNLRQHIHATIAVFAVFDSAIQSYLQCSRSVFLFSAPVCCAICIS